MDHKDHVYLLEGDPGVRYAAGLPLRGAGGVWADLGAGSGAFTLALAELLGKGAQIHAVDRDHRALEHLIVAMRKTFPDTPLFTHQVDFSHLLNLPALDGIVMANALHFIPDRQKPAVLERLRGVLRPGGQLIVVEYGTDRGNTWVPHPFSYATWQKLVEASGYTKITYLARRPSSFLGHFYSSVACKPVDLPD